MAKITSKGIIRGAVGPVVMYEDNGKQHMRSKPKKNPKMLRMTTATKSSAAEFGRAISAGKALRAALLPLLQNMHESRMHTRLATKIFEAMRAFSPAPGTLRSLADADLSLLDGFALNSQSIYNEYSNLNPEITVSGNGSLSIKTAAFTPGDDIVRVTSAAKAELCILSCGLDPVTLATVKDDMSKLSFSLFEGEVAAAEWTLTGYAAGSIIVVAAAVMYIGEDRLLGSFTLNDRSMHPAAIIKIFRS